MIADADGEFEVTVTMVRRRARLQCHDRTLSERLHGHVKPLCDASSQNKTNPTNPD